MNRNHRNNHFLPQNRRRQLDPTRHLQSRELWNRVRYYESEPNPCRLKIASAKFQAILYEIQPFRVRPLLERTRIFLVQEDGAVQIKNKTLDCINWCAGVLKSLIRLLARISKWAHGELKECNKWQLFRLFYLTASTIFGVYAWYRTVLYMHEHYAAGPAVIILTFIALILGPGLSDHTDTSVPSAYSVFNGGMRLLGDLDADTLARQFAGGGGLGGMAERVGNNDVVHPGDNDNIDNIAIQHNAEEDEQVNERRRRRRLEEAQDDIAPAAQAAPLLDEDDPDSEEDENAAPDAVANRNDGRRRKSGKKARRRNLELRREMQRQRQAAAAMGFGMGDGDNDARDREARMALEGN
ncbi:hypothetical protein THAOC_10446 [Thalassiosira oceanica]|uniref:SAYSvFN domain-containing protein n=1 Tax=Thalassiosira oceanica TaxID=159749 RepID=K0TCZ9_THAOC|nr:hypothetical protein THAOC_10446 [Thalassiosira oceanica]|mmetsp:Transcript_12885/g.30461  ORF Transcript_12885/g.30461 Transcript_12885/m.30461 type:complete len:354 (-) Transcript_12885:38-1099(-)|eukprot:EJK68377.1 hypothetical protein THAOC_10446 [Thalassiosira oceanica]